MTDVENRRLWNEPPADADDMAADAISRAPSLAVSVEIAESLIAHAKWSGEECSWPTPPTSVNGSQNIVDAAPLPDLPGVYNGSAGIAFFLMQLSRRTSSEHFRRHAVGGCEHALRTVASGGRGSSSFFYGATGVAFVLAHASQLFDVQRYAATARRMITQLPKRIVPGEPHDICFGTAGAVLGCLRVSEVLADVSLLDGAVTLSDQLIRSATVEATGWSWRSNAPRGRNLTGVAHGSTGIALALLEMFAVTSDARYAHAAEEALAYERQFFSEENGNWIDLRYQPLGRVVQLMSRQRQGDGEDIVRALDAMPPFAPRYVNGWCNGAAGMLMVRLRAYELLQRDIYREEATRVLPVVKAAVRAAANKDWSPCCGTIGRCEALRMAAKILGDLEAANVVGTAADHAGKGLATSITKRAASALSGEQRGLMKGDAGVGYFFLRLADASTPNLLTLAPASKVRGTPLHKEHASDAEKIKTLRGKSALAHFATTLGVFERLATGGVSLHDGQAAAAESLPGAHAGEVFESLVSAVEGERQSARAALLADAFAPERTRYEMLTQQPWQCEGQSKRIRRQVTKAPNWSVCSLRLSEYARLVTTDRDWEAWLHGRTEHSESPVTYLCYPYDGTVRLERLEPCARIVLLSIREVIDYASLLALVMDPMARQGWGNIVEEALRVELTTAYEKDALDVYAVGQKYQ